MRCKYIFIQMLMLNQLMVALARQSRYRAHRFKGNKIEGLGNPYHKKNNGKKINVTADAEFSPPSGEVWPVPKSEHKQKLFYSLNPELKFEIYLQTGFALLDSTIHRFLYQYAKLRSYSKESDAVHDNMFYAGEIKLIKIGIDECCETLHSEMIEEYKLKIGSVIKIQAARLTGVVRALDTLYQLLYLNDDKTIVINKNTISDAPKFMYRGLMLDTESHYISVENIMKMLDTMAMNKMNVFHWRIVGDTSFPYKSNVFPELSEKGAFHERMVYNETDIKDILDFATLRGIIVIPEFDILSHMSSLAKSHPEIYVSCSEDGSPGALNLAAQSTFDFLKKLMTEFQERFPDGTMHIGGRNVDQQLKCWDANPDIQKYISGNPSFLDPHLRFIKKLIKDNVFKADMQIIVAQQALNRPMVKFVYSEDTIAHVYDKTTYKALSKCADTYVLVSWPWDFSSEDQVSIAEMYEKAAGIEKIHACIGGEVLLYTHTIDDTNLFDRAWPRVSIAADVLWHGMDDEDILPEKMGRKYTRIEEQVKRMALLGIPVPPISSGFYEVNDKDKPNHKLKLNISLKPKDDFKI